MSGINLFDGQFFPGQTIQFVGGPGKVPGGTPVETLISLAGLTLSGDMTNQGGLAAARDGVTSQARASSAAKSAGDRTTATWRVDLGSGITKKVTRFQVWGGSDFSGFSTGSENVTIILEGSNDGSSWTTLYTSSATASAAGQTINVTSGIDTSTAYRHFGIRFSKPNSTDDAVLAEVRFYETI